MTSPRDIPPRRVQYYVTAPYECSYLADHRARSQVATPNEMIDDAVYSQLIRHGFRRSGLYTYRPHCDHCRACVPVRLPVEELSPDRSQRRAWARNAGLASRLQELRFYPRHYELYRRYQSIRHQGGGMDQDSEEQYRQFLLQSEVTSLLVEFSDGEALRMVSVIDVVADGLSSVYTFFDQERSQAGYGTYNVLWQANLCRQLGLPYLYLGYWIGASRKMSYKARFQPLEGLVGGVWTRGIGTEGEEGRR